MDEHQNLLFRINLVNEIRKRLTRIGIPFLTIGQALDKVRIYVRDMGSSDKIKSLLFDDEKEFVVIEKI